MSTARRGKGAERAGACLRRLGVLFAASVVMWGSAAALAVGCGSFSSGDPDDAGASVPPTESGADDVGLPGPDAGVDGAVTDAGGRDVDAATRLIVFVTVSSYASVNSALMADTICSGEASGRLPGKYRAWFSTPTTGALERLTGLGLDGPWYRPDGQRVVATAAALGNADVVPLESPIRINAAGAVASGNAWTGTLPTGAVGTLCPNPDPTKGDITKVSGEWTSHNPFVAQCANAFALYCFQVE